MKPRLYTFQSIAIFIGTMMIYRWIRGTVFQAFLEFSPWWLSCLNVGVPWGFVRTWGCSMVLSYFNHKDHCYNSTTTCYNFSRKIMQQDQTINHPLGVHEFKHPKKKLNDWTWEHHLYHPEKERTRGEIFPGGSYWKPSICDFPNAIVAWFW